MKTKNKLVALVEIAIVLCSVFLVTLPTIASEQNQAVQEVSASTITTASEDDFVLDIYGNANEDDTIDMGDVVYTKLAIFGKKPKTELCDAKYDGRINVLDVIQTKLIILGKEKELTVIDTLDRIVTVKKPIKRVVVGFHFTLETLRAIKVPREIIVGVPSYPKVAAWETYFAEYKDRPGIGNMWNPDVEAILNLDPDVVFLTAADWYEGVVNLVKERVETIPEEDKPKVYYETRKLWSASIERIARIGLAGGKSIFPDGGAIDPEAVIKEDPDIILKLAVGEDVTGYHLDAGDTTEIEKVREEVMSRPELQRVKAVKEGKVYILSTYFVAGGGQGHSGVRSILQIIYHAKWFHPTLFEDLDPKAYHQEYLTRFQGLDIDLDEKGVFVYHPEEHPDGH
jgi:iron complex transport system substrate-binding protein